MTLTLRIVLALFAVAGAVWAGWEETWLVLVVMLLPATRLLALGRGGVFRARFGGFLLTLAIAVLGAVALHIVMAGIVRGFVRPAQVLWTAWFLTGCLTFLDAVDLLLRRGVMKAKPAGAFVRTGIRAVVLLVIVIPMVAVSAEVIRPKMGYALSPAARRLDPAAFATRTVDGLTIRGYFFDRGYPTTVIFVHGSSSNAQTFLPHYLRVLEANPVNGLIFDLRAHGYSDGHVTSFGYHERKDVAAVVEWLTSRHPRASEQLMFYGLSMGAAAMLPVAVRTPRTIGVIIHSSFARLTAVARSMTDFFPPAVQQVLYQVGMPLFGVLTGAPVWEVEPIESIQRLGRRDVPVWVVHGRGDPVIPWTQARKMMRYPHVSGYIIPRGDHTNLATVGPEYYRRMNRFMRRVLGERRNMAHVRPR